MHRTTYPARADQTLRTLQTVLLLTNEGTVRMWDPPQRGKRHPGHRHLQQKHCHKYSQAGFVSDKVTRNASDLADKARTAGLRSRSKNSPKAAENEGIYNSDSFRILPPLYLSHDAEMLRVKNGGFMLLRKSSEMKFISTKPAPESFK